MCTEENLGKNPIETTHCQTSGSQHGCTSLSLQSRRAAKPQGKYEDVDVTFSIKMCSTCKHWKKRPWPSSTTWTERCLYLHSTARERKFSRMWTFLCMDEKAWHLTFTAFSVPGWSRTVRFLIPAGLQDSELSCKRNPHSSLHLHTHNGSDVLDYFHSVPH